MGKSLDAERALERLESEAWARLPRGCLAAWDSVLSRRSDHSEASEEERGRGDTLAGILDSFADTGERASGGVAWLGDFGWPMLG